MDSFSDVFDRVKQLCRGEMSEVAYDLWIKELELVSLDSSTARLQCSTQFKRDIVNEKYNALLTNCFEEIMGFPVQVEIFSREVPPAAPAPAAAAAPVQDDPVAVLQKLKAMLDAGLIPQEVYDKKMQEVLSRM